MTTLIFLLTFLSLIVLVINIIIKVIKHRPINSTLKTIGIIVLGYLIFWLIFYFKSTQIIVPLGNDVCFDDWCASITQIENNPILQKRFSLFSADSSYIIVHIRVSNHARGIAQKPSEPRIHIIDRQGHSWGYSIKGQNVIEKELGIQTGIGEKLALHQSLETKLVYAIPHHTKGLQLVIEEGSFITNLLFPENKSVFKVD